MKKINIRQNVLAINDEIAQKNRDNLHKHDVFTINIISSPGAGKTTLLEKTIKSLKDKYNILIIIGDVQTEADADRLRAAGGNAHQIITHGACHLDARMIQRELENHELERIDLLVIENVGNLVCPATYDLGEDFKIVILSVPEGDEKPLKYPAVFHRAELMIISKTDMLENTDFNVEKAISNAKKINPDIETIVLSSLKNSGMNRWLEWLEHRIRIHKSEVLN